MKTFVCLSRVVPAVLCALLAGWTGSAWIDRLYLAAKSKDILSFPDAVASRSRFRKPLLALLLLLSFVRLWSIIGNPFSLLYYTIAVAFLSFATATDLEQYVIFDAMLLPFALAGLCYTLHMQLPVENHIAAALGGGLLFFLLAVVTRGAVGGGDIKLVAAMGLWFGCRSLLQIIVYGLLAGGAAALIMLLAKQKNRHSYFAYGPYFALTGIGFLLGWLPF